MIQAVRAVVHERVSVDDAVGIYHDLSGGLDD